MSGRRTRAGTVLLAFRVLRPRILLLIAERLRSTRDNDVVVAYPLRRNRRCANGDVEVVAGDATRGMQRGDVVL